MSQITRRVAQSALLIAAAGLAPLLGGASAHADPTLGALGNLNGISTPDATPAVGTVADTGSALGQAQAVQGARQDVPKAVGEGVAVLPLPISGNVR